MCEQIKTGRRLAATTTNEFRHLFRFYLSEDSPRVTEIEVRIMTAADWKRITGEDRSFERSWSACELDGGMVMGLRGVAEPRPAGLDAPYPERAEKIRKLRSIVMDALEEHADEVGACYISCSLGGDGRADFNVDLRGGDIRLHDAEARVSVGPLDE